MKNNQIATVDAVDGPKINATLSIHARGTPVLGNYAIIKSDEDIILGRVASVKLTNKIHEDPTFAAWIMTNGAVPEWSGHVDIERAEIDVIRTRDNKSGKPVPLRKNPSSGTAVESIDMNEFLKFANEDKHICAIGEIPNSQMTATIINRHFGDIKEGGYGEARHVMIVGQNGSGKSVMATMLLAAKLAAHPRMGLLMPDTAGDLSKEDGYTGFDDFKWNYTEVLKRASVSLEIMEIDDIRLTSITLLKHLLGPFLHRELSMDSEKANTLAGRVANGLFDKEVISSKLTTESIIDQLREHIEHVYAKASREEKKRDVDNLATTQARLRPFDAGLKRIHRFFDGRERIDDLIKGILLNGRKVVIKMQGLGERDQIEVMRELMAKLVRMAQILFKSQAMQTANAIVMLDEGQRWIPEGTGFNNDDTDIGAIIQRAFRETRKYGLGWWVIAQRPSGISKTVISESRTKWFGRNVGIGADRKHLQDCLNDFGIDEYDRLMAQGGYFWMAVGQDNNIGTENMYFSVHPYEGDATQKFIDANPQIFSK